MGRSSWLLVFMILAVAQVNLYISWKSTRAGDSDHNASSSRTNSKLVVPISPSQNTHIDETDDDFIPPNSLDSLLTTRQRHRIPSHTACANTAGLYHIQMGDIGGAAGTIFFQFVVDQILYAERNNLTPWVYLNNVSDVVYDPLVHGRGPGVSLPPMAAHNATYVRHQGGHMKDFSPGPPDTNGNPPSGPRFLSGTGVWEHYFEPISPYEPGDRSCQTYVTMDLYLITPGLHGFTTWVPKCWRYHYLPDYATLPHTPFDEWIQTQRQLAHRVVKQYIRFRPAIYEAARRANPPTEDGPILGLHIRHSDKAAGRRVVATAEFLPYAQAFVREGGKAIYLATDSTAVLDEIRKIWPPTVVGMLRTFHALRSMNTTAIFDMGHHHQTNTEVLIEIQALSQCDYLVHGLSAVSESALWISPKPSVDLEDPDRLTSAQFRTLIQMRERGDPGSLPTPRRTNTWWNVSYDSGDLETPVPSDGCDRYKGVLWISNGGKHGVGKTFFTMILNQLKYAEEHNLLPWIHLHPGLNTDVYDSDYHERSGPQHQLEMLTGVSVSVETDAAGNTFPGKLEDGGSLEKKVFVAEGSGIWDSYFEPVVAYCPNKPLFELEPSHIRGMEMYDPTFIRAWRYDEVSEDTWLNQDVGRSREMAHRLISKYYRTRPYLLDRLQRVFPLRNKGPCLGVHIRNVDKQGEFRSKVKPIEYVAHMRSFVQGGGKCIYVATDSRSTLQYLQNKYEDLSPFLYDQGNQTVRSSKGRRREWLPHFYASHHRVNSETLVDILALSKCEFLVHGYSSVAEAAIYWNPKLVTVNLERDDMVKQQAFATFVKRTVQDWATKAVDKQLSIVTSRLDNATVAREEGICQKNAIVYLAQKRHSSYGRDSYGILLQSMSLLQKNYLNYNSEAVDLFVFHNGDFNSSDVTLLREALFNSSDTPILQDVLGGKACLHLVDLSGSPYWQRPVHQRKDNPADWKAWPAFSEGYRRMIHWFAIDIWRFFARYNEAYGCGYKYIWRMDEDSFLHSPIRYNIFDKMEAGGYVYGFRMCAYEMKSAGWMWKMWSTRNPDFRPYRNITQEMCGIYNNFFVADLDFFNSPSVIKFLRFIDRQGHIYRRRLGDLMIHSMSVFGFAPAERIHRFLDFTYEHSTLDVTNGCLLWGGIQAGYDDDRAAETISEFYDRQGNCSGARASYLSAPDLSPSYAHTPAGVQLSLFTVTAGPIELPAGKGNLSG